MERGGDTIRPTTNYHRVHHYLGQCGGPDLLNILLFKLTSVEVGHPQDLGYDLMDLTPFMVLILESLVQTNPPTDINCMQFWSRLDKLVVKLRPGDPATSVLTTCSLGDWSSSLLPLTQS